MSAGNRHLGYKEALNDIELRSPGSKADFYFGFLRRAATQFRSSAAGAGASGLGRCERCGSPSESETCAFCRLVERATSAPASQPAPVEVRLGPARPDEDPG